MAASEPERISVLRPQLAEISKELTAMVQPILVLSAGIHEEAADPSFDDILPFMEGIGQAAAMLKSMVEDLSRECALDDLLAKVEGETANVASMLRHELRNPLGAIKGFGEMIEEDLEDGPVLPLAQQLLNEINTLLTRLETLVTFSE